MLLKILLHRVQLVPLDIIQPRDNQLVLSVILENTRLHQVLPHALYVRLVHIVLLVVVRVLVAQLVLLLLHQECLVVHLVQQELSRIQLDCLAVTHAKLVNILLPSVVQVVDPVLLGLIA